MKPSLRVSRSTVARWHRWAGVALTLPLTAWIVSALALHLIVHDAPNGLQGVYELQRHNLTGPLLDEAAVAPATILRALAEDRIDEVYAMRLESHGRHLQYVVRPTPFALERTFDARTGARIDPLPDSVLLEIADGALRGTRAVRVLGRVAEYHRDYDVPAVPAVRIQMEGEQPSELILSRASGRTLRRLDAIATGFEAWYRSLHVFQWGDAIMVFTTVLFLTALAVVALGVLGIMLYVWRWGKRRPVALVWHGRVGMSVGVFLLVEVVVGAYMWLSLGPLQDPFRGKNTFEASWTGGVPTTAEVAPPGAVIAAAQREDDADGARVESIEWRGIAGRPVWIVTTARNAPGTVYDATNGSPWDTVPPAVIGRAVQGLMRGAPSFTYRGETEYYWNDLNRPVPVYQFTFDDPAKTDVYASRTTGEVVSRRTGFWRAFSPFLMIHTVAFTSSAALNTAALYLMLASLTTLVATGWWAWWRVR